jgi:hypothetical protein
MITASFRMRLGLETVCSRMRRQRVASGARARSDRKRDEGEKRQLCVERERGGTCGQLKGRNGYKGTHVAGVVAHLTPPECYAQAIKRRDEVGECVLGEVEPCDADVPAGHLKRFIISTSQVSEQLVWPAIAASARKSDARHAYQTPGNKSGASWNLWIEADWRCEYWLLAESGLMRLYNGPDTILEVPVMDCIAALRDDKMWHDVVLHGGVRHRASGIEPAAVSTRSHLAAPLLAGCAPPSCRLHAAAATRLATIRLLRSGMWINGIQAQVSPERSALARWKVGALQLGCSSVPSPAEIADPPRSDGSGAGITTD